ncbi:MAG: hypothetical protein HQ594_06955, partial [Candidatus Omnitrophica bacterium]|nr:hypothetical protein [Candidatus Omnitrophota bacterium]
MKYAKLFIISFVAFGMCIMPVYAQDPGAVIITRSEINEPLQEGDEGATGAPLKGGGLSPFLKGPSPAPKLLPPPGLVFLPLGEDITDPMGAYDATPKVEPADVAVNLAINQMLKTAASMNIIIPDPGMIKSNIVAESAYGYQVELNFSFPEENVSLAGTYDIRFLPQIPEAEPAMALGMAFEEFQVGPSIIRIDSGPFDVGGNASRASIREFSETGELLKTMEAIYENYDQFGNAATNVVEAFSPDGALLYREVSFATYVFEDPENRVGTITESTRVFDADGNFVKEITTIVASVGIDAADGRILSYKIAISSNEDFSAVDTIIDVERDSWDALGRPLGERVTLSTLDENGIMSPAASFYVTYDYVNGKTMIMFEDGTRVEQEGIHEPEEVVSDIMANLATMPEDLGLGLFLPGVMSITPDFRDDVTAEYPEESIERNDFGQITGFAQNTYDQNGGKIGTAVV